VEREAGLIIRRLRAHGGDGMENGARRERPNALFARGNQRTMTSYLVQCRVGIAELLSNSHAAETIVYKVIVRALDAARRA
jgi:hypothetical protein